MNPWTVVLLAIGAVLIISGYKGTQSNLLAAITGKTTGQASPTGAPASFTATTTTNATVPSAGHYTAT